MCRPSAKTESLGEVATSSRKYSQGEYAGQRSSEEWLGVGHLKCQPRRSFDGLSEWFLHVLLESIEGQPAKNFRLADLLLAAVRVKCKSALITA